MHCLFDDSKNMIFKLWPLPGKILFSRLYRYFICNWNLYTSTKEKLGNDSTVRKGYIVAVEKPRNLFSFIELKNGVGQDERTDSPRFHTWGENKEKQNRKKKEYIEWEKGEGWKGKRGCKREREFSFSAPWGNELSWPGTMAIVTNIIATSTTHFGLTFRIHQTRKTSERRTAKSIYFSLLPPFLSLSLSYTPNHPLKLSVLALRGLEQLVKWTQDLFALGCTQSFLLFLHGERVCVCLEKILIRSLYFLFENCLFR